MTMKTESLAGVSKANRRAPLMRLEALTLIMLLTWNNCAAQPPEPPPPPITSGEFGYGERESRPHPLISELHGQVGERYRAWISDEDNDYFQAYCRAGRLDGNVIGVVMWKQLSSVHIEWNRPYQDKSNLLSYVVVGNYIYLYGGGRPSSALEMTDGNKVYTAWAYYDDNGTYLGTKSPRKGATFRSCIFRD